MAPVIAPPVFCKTDADAPVTAAALDAAATADAAAAFSLTKAAAADTAAAFLLASADAADAELLVSLVALLVSLVALLVADVAAASTDACIVFWTSAVVPVSPKKLVFAI